MGALQTGEVELAGERHGMAVSAAMDAVIQGGHADRAAVIADRRVSPENLELVEQNRAEIQRLEDELDEIVG